MISCVSLEWTRPVVGFCPLSPASDPAPRTDLTVGEREQEFTGCSLFIMQTR